MISFLSMPMSGRSTGSVAAAWTAARTRQGCAATPITAAQASNVAGALAAANVCGGYVVTDRMLKMFKKPGGKK